MTYDVHHTVNTLVEWIGREGLGDDWGGGITGRETIGGVSTCIVWGRVRHEAHAEEDDEEIEPDGRRGEPAVAL